MSYPYPGREELTEGDWDEAWAWFHERERMIMLEDFRTACQGRPGADVSNLDWLAALLADLRETGWPFRTKDPSTSWEALVRSEALLRGLREAMRT